MEKDDRLKFNERKIIILELLRERPMTSREVAEECEISPSTVRSLFRRYHLNDLVEKKERIFQDGRGNNPTLYGLTDRAVDLLDDGKIKPWEKEV